jgi:cytoskeletal protein CcmA (bactofilin family)
MKATSLDGFINSILGENTTLKGIYMIKGPLRIDGNFYGKIESTGKVIIGKSGRAESTIIAKNVIIGGTIKGDVYSEDKVLILKTGEIIGNIYSCAITMEDGVIFNGKCKILNKDNMRDLIDKKKKEKFTIS